MKSSIVVDGAARFRASEDYQARLAALRESIHARHAVDLAKAGLLRRWFLRWRMAAEFRRQRKRITPSPSSLYLKR
jgi:hypothetical protein